MATGHGRFALLNRAGNPIVKAILRSPIHRLASGRVALITVTGRRTGRRFTIPVEYVRRDDRVTINVGWPERKRWWRNLRQPAPVVVRLGGRDYTGTAVAEGEEHDRMVVQVILDG